MKHLATIKGHVDNAGGFGKIAGMLTGGGGGGGGGAE